MDLDLLGAEEVGVDSGALETDLDERVVGVSLIGGTDLLDILVGSL